MGEALKDWKRTDRCFDSCPFTFDGEQVSVISFKPDGPFAKAETHHAAAKGYCTECGNTYYRYEPFPGVGLYGGHLWNVFSQVRKCPGAAPDRFCSLFNAAKIPAQFTLASIEAAITSGRPHQANAIRRIVQILESVKAHRKDTGQRAPHGLTFLGPTGSGKSHLCAAVIRHMVFTYGLTCLWVDLETLSRNVRATYNRETSDLPDWRKPGEVEIMNQVCNAPLLVIDDIGRGKGHGAKLVEEIVVRRRDRVDVQTWATSNLSLRELERLMDRRAVSRLGSIAPIFNFDGDDQRQLEQSSDFEEDDDIWPESDELENPLEVGAGSEDGIDFAEEGER